jgi:hypothetical protein
MGMMHAKHFQSLLVVEKWALRGKTCHSFTLSPEAVPLISS